MNLELLDPFGRQIPDRVDATLPLAPHLHFRQPNHHLVVGGGSGTPSSNKKSSKGENNDQNRHSNSSNVNSFASNSIGSGLSETGGTIAGVVNKREMPEWRAAYQVAYNRRGTYLAVGYGSGAVAVHSTSSRTLSALYRSNAGSTTTASEASPRGEAASAAGTGTELVGSNGVTSVSWSRRSRTLLTGAAGDISTQVYDTTHPFGPEEAGLSIDDQKAPEDADAGETRGRPRKDSVQQTVTDYENRDHIPPLHPKRRTAPTLFADPVFDELKYVFVKEGLQLESVEVLMGARVPRNVIEAFVLPEPSPDTDPPEDWGSDVEGEDESRKDKKRKKKKKKKKKKRSNERDNRLRKHPYVSFSFRGKKSVGGSLQINPRVPTGGLAALMDGSLVLFWFEPETSWVTRMEPKGEDRGEADGDDRSQAKDDGGSKAPSPKPGKKKAPKQPTKYVVTVPLWTQTGRHFITCAAFDPQGERVYAASKDGTLLGFEVRLLFESLASHSPSRAGSPVVIPKSAYSSTVVASPIKGGLPLVAPHFKISIPGRASAWHLLVSRNGKYLVLNSSDGALRLYSTQTCWKHGDKKGKEVSSSTKPSELPIETPDWTFQDVVSKVKFVSCDLSGDGEYVVGGANIGGANAGRYELSIWNTTTGGLMDKLTGPAVQLYSVAWHPTRACLAVATSDGLVDVWGPKMNWTAFAPDFQALHKNVVYEEKDDEEDENEEAKAASSSSAMDVDEGEEKPSAKRKKTKRPPAEEGEGRRPKKKEPPQGSDNSGIATDKDVDVLALEPIPMFASDSEEETDAFAFETRVKNLFHFRLAKGGKAEKSEE